MKKLTFSGHESFPCKQFWLKKGFDFVEQGKSFNSDEAVIDLGVGKNMVRSIRFWLHAFGISNDRSGSKPSELGIYLFGKDGRDPYLEDIGSTWLLHYFLVKGGEASIYYLIFNQFRKARPEFTSEQLHNYLKKVCNETASASYNSNTIDRDIKVFIQNCRTPTSHRTQIEDAYSSLLYELDLLGVAQKESVVELKRQDYFSIHTGGKGSLPCDIVLFAILDFAGDARTVSFNELLSSENSPGSIFALSGDELLAKIQCISDRHDSVIYTQTAGNRQLQFSKELDKWEVLNGYYN